MNAIAKLVLIYLWSVAISGAEISPKYDLLNNIPIPENAIEVKKIIIGTTTNQQLFFKIRSIYPSKAIVIFYREYFHHNNWVECRGKSNRWDSYPDSSLSDTPFLVHESAHYWIRRNEVAYLVVRYYSPWNGEKTNPTTDKQHVSLLIRNGVKSIDLELSRFAVTCPLSPRRAD